MPRLVTALLALALTATACGTTVQQSTLQSNGAPVGTGGPDSGLTVPGDTTDAASDSSTGSTTPGLVGGAPSAGGTTPDTIPVDSTAPGTSGPQARAPQPAPGAADRTPLKLGLLYVNNDAAASVGVDNGNTFSPRRVLEALIADTNARGGLAGRRIVPTWFEIRSSSTAYAADLQAACSRFAEDAEVSVVISFLGLAEEQLSPCLAKAGIPHVNGSYGLGDQTSMAAQPITVSPTALSADRRAAALLERMKAAGHLTGTSRIGVLVEGCPYNERAVERTLVPSAKRLGLSIVSTRSTRCFNGINDLSGMASDAQGAVLEFTSQRVDRVVIVSAIEGNMMLVFATAAESQGYRPGYALSSLALPNVVKDNIPHAQLVAAKGMGWLPSLDDSADLTPTPAADACLARLKGQGLSPTGAADHFFALGPCDAFGLTAQVLQQSGGSATAQRWNAALNAVGGGFAAASVVDGRMDFRDGRRDGPARARTFAWNGDCSCFRYTGASYVI